MKGLDQDLTYVVLLGDEEIDVNADQVLEHKLEEDRELEKRFLKFSSDHQETNGLLSVFYE